jgi:hypothetical protein
MALEPDPHPIDIAPPHAGERWGVDGYFVVQSGSLVEKALDRGYAELKKDASRQAHEKDSR